MIDTLKVSLSDYHVSDSTQLRLKPATIDLSTGEQVGCYTLWKASSGSAVEGSGAYWNGDTLRVDVTPKGDSVQCFVEASLPKYATGDNLSPIDRNAVQVALRNIERQLRDIGIGTNIETARLSRIDTFRNVLADEPFTTYTPVLSLMRMRRQRSRDYGTTFLFSNSQQETCIYDKRAEMKHRGLDVSRVPPNVMRFEHRLKTGRKIRSTLGVGTVGDLMKCYDVVPEHHLRTMREELFKYEPGEVETMTGDQYVAGMLLFQARFPKTWEARYFDALGRYTAAKAGGVEAVRRAIEIVASGDDEAVRKRVYRHGRSMDEAYTLLSMLERPEGSKTLGDLYRELRAKATADD